MVEMSALMELGAAAATPAVMVILHELEKLFDPKRPLLVLLDEAWVFLDHPVMQPKIKSYLKTLRKYLVYMVFATQEVNDVLSLGITSTIIEQCLTKIFLANPLATESAETYERMGLKKPETEQIASARMKRDYFYKSPLGMRVFDLDLGPLTLGLIAGQDHEYLNRLEREVAPEEHLFAILAQKNIDYRPYLPDREGDS